MAWFISIRRFYVVQISEILAENRVAGSCCFFCSLLKTSVYDVCDSSGKDSKEGLGRWLEQRLVPIALLVELRP